MNATDNACPTCGAPDHSCPGDARTNTRLIITNDGARKVTGPLRLPRQKNTIGRAGYVGNVETYDPRHPDVRLVQDHEAEAVEEVRIDQGSDIDQIMAGARRLSPQAAADEAQAADPQDDAAEGPEAATAPSGAERDGAMAKGTAPAVKQRKPGPDDKSRKSETGTKK